MRLLYTILFLLTSLHFVFSQPVPNPINTKIDSIKDSLFFRLNTERAFLGLTLLKPNSLLTKLADLQGLYCLKNNLETHLQESKNLKTLLDRKQFLEVENGTVNEIVCKIDLKKDNLISSNQILNAIFISIAKNKEYTNFLKSKSNCEIGIFADNKEDFFYVTIVLGSKVVFTKSLQTTGNEYKIKNRAQDSKGICDKCIKKLDAMPKDVSYDLTIINDEIYFAISNQEWFHKLFYNKLDGVAVDIVLKSQFPCDNANIDTESPVSSGYLLRPVYLKQMLKTATMNNKGNVFVPLGKVPEVWKNEAYELNVLIIQNNILCQYGTFFQVPFDDWQTIEIPFDMSLNHRKSKIEETIHKEMNFVIPFAQGKAVFDAQDLKPLADSLKLAHYTITSIDILAYSSVEGSKIINLELQKQRALSMVNAIQSYQSYPINAKINTAENWTAFFADIQTTSKGYLATKSENEIRAYLNANRIEEIDALLANHRKGIIHIELERKQLFKNLDEKTILNILNDSSFNKGTEKYQLIDDVYLSENPKLMRFLAANIQPKLKWSPESRAKIAINEYLLDTTQLLNTLEKVTGLIVENNSSPMIQFNYYALKLLDWERNLFTGDIPKILKQQLLTNKTIETQALNKLRLNYFVLETQYYTHAQKFDVKNESVQQLIKVLPNVQLSDEERFRIAKFLAAHHQYKVALDLLAPRTKISGVHEDLLFLYINLSIIEEKVVQKPDYRAILSNASVVNKTRFCGLFNSAFNGGITFQLLENKYLKRSYCEICE